MSSIFSTLPPNFFSPLASPNREHYAACLLAFYRAFQETSGGVERSVAVSRFAEYLAGRDIELAEEPGIAEALLESEILPLFPDSDAEGMLPTDAMAKPDSSRIVATRFVRTLVAAGWMTEETLQDYTRILNISPFAKPFLEALARVDEGLKMEYESHVVAVYSLLCGDASAENGHYAVLNAHSHTMALIDSLKVLSQSIKGHYERFFLASAAAQVKDLLHLHYDLYANEVLDGAYKRIKTSDNLSRYRPRITSRANELLSDAPWLDASASKLARMSTDPIPEARSRLVSMLEEIRDTLKAVDPLLEDIDRRNMLYARTSVERIRTLLQSDATMSGRIAEAARAVRADSSLAPRVAHRVHRVRAATPASRYRGWLRDRLDPVAVERVAADPAEIARIEAEIRLRIDRQLGPDKIRAWLDEAGGAERALGSAELAVGAEGFVRLLYAVLYSDSRKSFAYRIEEGPGESIEAGRYLVPDLKFWRKK